MNADLEATKWIRPRPVVRVRNAAFTITLGWSIVAGATPELVAPDPRGLGMGGLGVAAADDASATHHNPARLQAITKASFVLGLSALYAHQEAPLPFPPPEDPKGTSNIFAPFGMLGGAYRLSPRFVVGLSVLPGSASAGRYELKNGTELSATAITAEAQLAASFAVLDNLWIGVEYRASYVNQTLKQPMVLADNTVFQMKTSLDAFNFLGAAAGIYYEPVRGTGIGFAYRSQMSRDISGTTDLPVGSFSTHSHAATPDKFTLGISQRFLGDALLLNLQGALVMSPWIDQSTTTTIDTPGAPTSTTMVTNDRTFWEAKLGGEYWLDERWALRAGLILGNENARKGYVSPFSSPPSDFFTAPTLGAGAKFDKWLIDAAMWWLIDHGNQVSQTQNGAPGDYRRSGFVGMVSLRYSI